MTELKPFIQSDDKQVAYYGYKAGAWLDYAYSEDVEGSLSKAGEFALAEGLSILQALRENRTDTLLMTTDIPPTSTLMRAGLWASLASLKDNGGTESSPPES